VSYVFLKTIASFYASSITFCKNIIAANHKSLIDFSLIPTTDLLPKLPTTPRVAMPQTDDFEQIAETMVVVERRKRRRVRTRTANLERGTTLSDYAILEPTRRNFLPRNVALERSVTAVTTSENISRRANGKI